MGTQGAAHTDPGAEWEPGCCFVSTLVLGEVCLESAAWPPWASSASFPFPKFVFMDQCPGARLHGLRETEKWSDVHSSPRPNTCSQLCAQDLERHNRQSQGLVYVPFEGCPLETSVWGTGPCPWGAEPTYVWGRVTEKAKQGMLSPSHGTSPTGS